MQCQVFALLPKRSSRLGVGGRVKRGLRRCACAYWGYDGRSLGLEVGGRLAGSRVIGMMGAAAVHCECELCMRLKLTACQSHSENKGV